MRIEGTGASANVNPVQSTQSSGAARTDSAASGVNKPEPKKHEVKDLSAVKKMEHYQKEAEKVSEENQEEQEQKVIKAIEQANKHIRTYDRRLEFSIHDTTKQIMVKVINTEDDSTIREIPSEKILDMVAHLWEMAGILVDEKR